MAAYFKAVSPAFRSAASIIRFIAVAVSPEDCEDERVADRLRLMPADLAAKADYVDKLPSERLRRTKPLLAA